MNPVKQESYRPLAFFRNRLCFVFAVFAGYHKTGEVYDQNQKQVSM